MKMHTILSDRLYQRGQMNKTAYAVKLTAFHEYDISMVMCLTRKYDPDLVSMHNEQMLFYVYKPLSDGKLSADSIPTLKRLVQIGCNEIRSGGRVLTHCAAGINRSGLVSALIVRELLGCNGTDAVDIVRAGRPRALSNEHFVLFLESLSAPVK